ncbi:SdrD B-like domain-containing protein [Arcticibacterium luteifluviistationis]|nr:SdrD B-like domain-containing protein [Arcticibacterium luteifluviistationis]
MFTLKTKRENENPPLSLTDTKIKNSTTILGLGYTVVKACHPYSELKLKRTSEVSNTSNASAIRKAKLAYKNSRTAAYNYFISCKILTNMTSSLLKRDSLLKYTTALVLFLTLSASSLFGQDIDIALKQSIDKPSPMIGETINYTVYVKNEGATNATGITVNNQTPFGAITNVTLAPENGVANYNAANGLIDWTIPSLVAGDSVKLDISAVTASEGIYFSVAEIVAADQNDIDSNPGNSSLFEDDMSNSCFSIPLTWYPGEEYEISIPAPFNGVGIKWFKDGLEIDANTVGASINPDSTLSIFSVGAYTFQTSNTVCPANGCCPVILEEGPYGSIGDYVWQDANKNGVQDFGESPISNILVILLNDIGTALDSAYTNGDGQYLFDSLTTGDYQVLFNAPSSYAFSPSDISTDDTDSDAGTDGRTPTISIDTSLPLGNKARNNNDVDAGIYVNEACSEIASITVSDDNLCVGDSTFLMASTTNASDILWYYSSAGGSPIFTTQSGVQQLIYPTTTTTYYAELASTPTSCVNPRMPVAVVVNARPSNPSCFNVIEVCGSETLNLNDLIINGITTPGGVFEWHSGPLSSSPLMTSTTAVGSGKYYLFEKSGAGCYSNPAVAEIVEKTCELFVDLELIKVADTRIVAVNDIVNYTITVSNSGPDAATNVTVQDILPEGLEFVSSINFTNTAGTLSASIPSIAVNQTITLKYATRVVGSGNIVNVAEIMSADQVDLDSTPGNGLTMNEDDDDDEIIQVISDNPVADLSLQKLVSDTSPSQGDEISYSIRVTNNGPDAATNVEVTDVLPEGLSHVSSAGASNITVTDNLIKANFDVIAVGQTLQFSIRANVTAESGTVSNRAEVTAADQADPDSNPASGVGEDDEDTVDINITPACNPLTPIISSNNMAICNGQSTTLVAAGCTGTVEWSDGSIGASVTVSPTAITNYTAICRVNTCVSEESNLLTIIVSAPTTPTITASNSNICSGELVTLTAAGCNGNVNWSNGMTGTSINVTPSTTTTYTAMCTVGTCTGDASGTVTIEVGEGQAPVITASSKNICSGDQVTLSVTNCTGNITWSTGATTASITASPTVTTTYSVTCGSSSCSGTSFETINVGTGLNPTVTASSSEICTGESTTLSVANCTDAVLWSTGATTGSISVSPTANTTYTVTCGTGNCSGEASININVGTGQAPVIAASASQVCEATDVTLTATGCSGTVNWSNGQSGSSITANITANTSFTATCSSGTCVSGNSNTINITIGDLDSPNITSSGTVVCSGSSVTLTASNCSGTVLWSDGQTGAEISVSPVFETTYTANCQEGSCLSDASNAITIGILNETPSTPVISCSASRICPGESITLNGLGCEGTVLWSDGSTGNSITVSPSVTTVYTASCWIGTCQSPISAPATINVGNPFPPQLRCQNTLICLGASTTLEAAGCVGTVVWNTGETGSVINVSPTTMTSYSAFCKGSTCQSEESNVITVGVTNNSITPPTVTTLTNVCPVETVNLNDAITSTANTSGGSFVFRMENSPNSAEVSNATAIATSGTFYVFENGGNGCYSAGAKIDVGVIACESPVDCQINPATASAGTDTTICLAGDSYSLNGNIGGSAQTSTWTTSGSGTFGNAMSPTSEYFYSAADISNGSVTLTLTTNDPDGEGACTAATASMTITVNGIDVVPTIDTDKSPIICEGDSVTLEANQTAAGYLWSNGASTKSIKVGTPGNYTVKLINADGCSSLSSEVMEVTNMSGVTGPTVNDLANNTCPSTTVDLNNHVLSSLTSASSSFEFHTGITPDSPMLGNVSTMPTGDYYVFERTELGCYSNPSLIKVIIEDCNIEKVDAEVGILIVGNESSISIGDEITYTITVTNNGPNTATNVKIENEIPNGIDIVSSTPGLTLANGNLITTIDSIPSGTSRTFIYTAEITESGILSNVANIISLDQNDPILSNNSSHFDIECITCQQVCIATALKADTLRQGDGTYNIQFTALIQNCDNVVDLSKVTLKANMNSMFGTTASYSLVQQPTVNTGSGLVPNPNYDGNADVNLLDITSALEGGLTDTVRWTVNLVPNGTEGPYSVNAFASGTGKTIFDLDIDVSDVSNDGSVIEAPSGDPTVVRLYKTPSIGLSLAIIDTLTEFDGSLNVTYQALVKNNGAIPLSNVIVSDTLSNTYALPATYAILGTPTVNDGSSLVININYDGNSDPNLTLASSTLDIGVTDTIIFKVNVSPNGVEEFINQAIAQGTGTLNGGGTETVVDVSNTGYNPDAPGSEPTMLDLNPDNTQSTQDPCLGVALYVSDSTKLADGSFDITYTALISNCGNVNLTNISLCDSLSSGFGLPSVVTLKNAPSLGLNSTLSLDATYDGETSTCMLNSTSTLAPNKVDTVRWTVNLTLNSNNGPFRKNVTVTANSSDDETISDISNDGTNPSPEGSNPTVLNFNNLPDDLIGLSKEMVSIEEISDSVYDVVFKFNIKNYGIIDFTGVQLQDNLAETFGSDVMIDSVSIFDVSDGLVVNPNFTGKGILINMLVDTLSTLPVKTTKSLSLYTRLDLSQSNSTYHENMALAIGYQNGTSTDDLSTVGSNPDPDADGTPENNSDPTPIEFPDLPNNVTPLGISKSISDTVSIVDGSYQITYTVVVKNYGDEELTNVQLTDSLSTVFGDSTDLALVGSPTLNGSSLLDLNPDFDGMTDLSFLITSNSTLAAGASDTLTFKVKVRNNSSQSASYSNTIYGVGDNSAGTVTDMSTEGLDPDTDNDGNPGNNNIPTVIVLEGGQSSNPTNLAFAIPGGLSPNNDGVNDNLVITGITEADEVKLRVYNRWGELVFETENYKLLFPGASDGWDGTANTGIRPSKQATQLPDGTYFYSAESSNTELFEGKAYYNFITIAGGNKK